jgi:hypothetical protein
MTARPDGAPVNALKRLQRRKSIALRRPRTKDLAISIRIGGDAIGHR